MKKLKTLTVVLTLLSGWNLHAQGHLNLTLLNADPNERYILSFPGCDYFAFPGSAPNQVLNLVSGYTGLGGEQVIPPSPFLANGVNGSFGDFTHGPSWYVDYSAVTDLSRDYGLTIDVAALTDAGLAGTIQAMPVTGGLPTPPPGSQWVLVTSDNPLPVTLGGLSTAQDYFLTGLELGTGIAAILLGFIAVRRALSMGDSWND